ncbi:LysR family transcriptional regulator [Aquabacterium sp.]|uniref:LysR family transcriptional regulator n=1 Tax=Aquabacterium sp. TaxID=1872578 RepID=UPI002D1CB1CF|nr:LysR family transcriptional regulator [Aquabacterium sp.]HSW03874.1 LysR family transcriptional regulator [Aquabacterium sp.]
MSAAGEGSGAALRLLRSVEAVARLGSAARAAGELHLSVSAVSRAVVQSEMALGVVLFDRVARGMNPTLAGTLIAARMRRALAELRSGGGVPLATRATDAMLQVLVAVAESRSEGAAASRLGVSQPAVHQSLKQLEHAAKQRLLLRTRSGTRLTDEGERVLRAAKLALSELRTGRDELAALLGSSPGRVAVGALPMTADVLVPQALSRLFAAQPGIIVTVADGTYEALLHQLRHGDLDLVVGPLRGAEAAADVAEQPLFIDRLLPVVRAQHPLVVSSGTGTGPRARGPSSLRTLLRWPWIGPLPGTPARAAFERAFVGAGLAVPVVALQANSPAVVRSVLMSGDHVAMLSPLQIRAELASGLLKLLPVVVAGTQRSIGVMQRRDSLPSAAVSSLLAELRALAGELAGSPPSGRSSGPS